jgi:hypothetical protein
MGVGSSNDNVRILVELPSDRTIDGPSDASNTINEVKFEIQTKIGIPIEEQMLLEKSRRVG